MADADGEGVVATTARINESGVLMGARRQFERPVAVYRSLDGGLVEERGEVAAEGGLPFGAGAFWVISNRSVDR